MKSAFRKTDRNMLPYEDRRSNSKGSVLHIINPSLYSFRMRHTPITLTRHLHRSEAVDYMHEGEICGDNSIRKTRSWYKDGTYRDNLKSLPEPKFWSLPYQWLPADVTWDEDGDAQLESYINNLHPSHEEAYWLIEGLINESIPLWNLVFSYMDHERPRRIDPSSYQTTCPTPPLEFDTEEDEFYDWMDANRAIIDPEPNIHAFDNASSYPTINLVDDFPGDVQVIVRLNNIELTPEGPQLTSGTWHIEGMMNEHICAACIFVFDSVNILGNAIDFRQRSDFDEFHDLCGYIDYYDFADVLGIADGEEVYQRLGRVPLPEGRLVAFPNVLQARAADLRLADPTERGHCSFLTILLVDPSIRILSTANVPPRQHDWWAKALYPDPNHRLGILPSEIFHRILFFASDPSYSIGPQQARVEKAARDIDSLRFERALNRRVQTADID